MEARVLGPIECFDGTTAISLPRSERTVLAALAARAGERVPATVLEEALWPGDRPSSARKTLQGYILRLRRVVGSAAIVEAGGAYRLDPDVVDIDARRVAVSVAAAREALRHKRWDVALELLTAARQAFRGHPYDGVADGALPAGEVQRLVELRNAILLDSAEAQLGGGRGEESIAELEAFVEVNPYHERAWSLLMRSLYQAGRPNDALAAFSRARLLLAAELGIEPGPALREVERAILSHDDALMAEGDGGRRLGDANLPAAVAPLIGRELELAVLDPLLDSERLITLTGVGGIGKTRLAIELAAGTAGRRPFGPYFLDLAPVADVALVPVGLAAALTVPIDPNEDAMTIVRAAIAEHSFLIVVDNCEHLLPGIAELLGGVLAAGTGVRIVATSREALGLAGERVCPLDPLRVPGAGAAPAEIEDSDAGKLFIARLPMNVTTAPLGPQDLEAIGRICRTLEGIPLGLELAAARCRTMPLARLADRVDGSIGDLAPSRHGVPARHRTMRAALDWGCELLSARAQAALRSAAVFVGGCGPEAFAAVCAGASAPDDELLDELVRTSFVTVDFAADRTRYRLLEPVRQYARELLGASGEAADVSRRHLGYYLDLAGTLTTELDHIGFDSQWDQLEPELGNFRAALDWAAADRESIERGLRLATRLWDVWASHGHHREGLTRIVGLVARGGGSHEARAAASYAAGFIAANVIGDDSEGARLWEQSLDEALAGGDRAGEVRVRRVLSTCAFARGEVESARQHLETAIPIAVEDGQGILRAYCELSLAEILHWSGDLDGAVGRIAEVLAGPDDVVGSVEIFAQLSSAPVLVDRGDYAKAHASAQRAIELADAHSMLHFQIEARLALAEVEVACCRPEPAAANLEAAEELSPATAAGWDPWFLHLRAEVALLGADTAAALELAEQAVAAGNEVDVAANRCSPLGLLGRAQLACGDAEHALDSFEQLIALAGIGPFPCRQADGHEGAAAAAIALGRPDVAGRHLALAGALRRRTGSRPVPRAVVDAELVRLGPGQVMDIH